MSVNDLSSFATAAAHESLSELLIAWAKVFGTESTIAVNAKAQTGLSVDDDRSSSVNENTTFAFSLAFRDRRIRRPLELTLSGDLSTGGKRSSSGNPRGGIRGSFSDSTGACDCGDALISGAMAFSTVHEIFEGLDVDYVTWLNVAVTTTFREGTNNQRTLSLLALKPTK